MTGLDLDEDGIGAILRGTARAFLSDTRLPMEAVAGLQRGILAELQRDPNLPALYVVPTVELDGRRGLHVTSEPPGDDVVLVLPIAEWLAQWRHELRAARRADPTSQTVQ